MKLRRPPRGVSWVHFCGWDRHCRSFDTPWHLYLHFLSDGQGASVRFDLSPPWVRRQYEAWLASLDWQETKGPDAAEAQP